ncbi:MAG TPA: hypothetical protein DEA05_12825 [Rhodobacteraceae bacterium]|nr:hypothetical protein [Paracoccaceae bacterium]
MVGRELFLSEIRRRGFTAVENGDQIIVFCNAQPVRLLTAGRQTLSESLPTNPREDLRPGFR